LQPEIEAHFPFQKFQERISFKTVTYYIVTCISVARKQLGKHILVKKNSWPKIDKGLSIAKQRAVNKFRQQ
jgi:hypothetical protein